MRDWPTWSRRRAPVKLRLCQFRRCKTDLGLPGHRCDCACESIMLSASFKTKALLTYAAMHCAGDQPEETGFSMEGKGRCLSPNLDDPDDRLSMACRGFW